MVGHRGPQQNNRSFEHNHPPEAHVHSHGVIDPSLLSTQRGIWAIKWSFIGLSATAAFQVVIVMFSGSVALLADTIHNFGDAATALPLWIAFRLARRKPTRRFTYGYGRVEDLAGLTIVLTILLSAVVAGYESMDRFFHPQTVKLLWAVIIASIVGFLGNEAVAQLRIRVGKEIGSAALIADGQHARVDGLASLAVFFGVVGIWLGYPLADPVVGLLITATILHIVWQSGKPIFARLLDGVDPEVIDEITHAVHHAQGVCGISEVRIRWLGHRLHAELNIGVSPKLSVEEGHRIAEEVRHQLLDHLRYLSNVTIHVDPVNASGAGPHCTTEHEDNDLTAHVH